MGRDPGDSICYISFWVQMRTPLLLFMVALEISDLEGIKVIFINSRSAHREFVIILINWTAFFSVLSIKRSLESEIMVSQREWSNF